MKTRFQEAKATQAAALFLKHADGKLPYIKLLKLLYMMDRESLHQWASSVTGDVYYSMKKGPVLSQVYGLITDELGLSLIWSAYIEKNGYDVKLVADPGTRDLSEAEMDLIRSVFQKYGHFEKFDLVDHLHEILPEWDQITEGRKPITIERILTVGNRSHEEILAIEQSLDEIEAVNAYFSAAR